VRLQLGRPHVDRQLLTDADAAVLLDPILDVDQADGAEREAAIRHHRHMQREGEHVRVSGGEMVAQGEAADPGVGGDLLRLGPHPGPVELELGDLAAAPRNEGQQRGAGDHRRRRAGVERQDAG